MNGDAVLQLLFFDVTAGVGLANEEISVPYKNSLNSLNEPKRLCSVLCPMQKCEVVPSSSDRSSSAGTD